MPPSRKDEKSSKSAVQPRGAGGRAPEGLWARYGECCVMPVCPIAGCRRSSPAFARCFWELVGGGGSRSSAVLRTTF